MNRIKQFYKTDKLFSEIGQGSYFFSKELEKGIIFKKIEPLRRKGESGVVNVVDEDGSAWCADEETLVYPVKIQARVVGG